jgi:hypothetical protein
MVFSTYERMFRRLDEGRALVGPSRFYELRYEDLVHEPVAQLSTLYERLGLGAFEAMRPPLEQYLAKLTGYHTGHHELPAKLNAQIAERCGEVIRRYGYTPPAGPSPTATGTASA